jgi:methyl-accepting chemotaxis protein
VIKLAKERNKQDEQAALDITEQRTLVLLVIGVSILAIVSLASGFIARGIVKLLGQAAWVLKDIAEGDGHLTKRVEVKSQDEVGEQARWSNIFMGKLHGLVSQVQIAITHITTASQQLSDASEQVSSGSQEQASSLEETAASLEEITGTVQQSADNAREANQLAIGSRAVAEKGAKSSPLLSMRWGKLTPPPTESPASSPPSTRLPSRPTCWPSIPPSKLPELASMDGALRWWQPKCGI